MKMGWTGLESAGKSQLMAVHAVKVLRRNIKWILKREEMGLPFIPRTMYFDSPMSPKFIAEVEKYGMKYVHFTELNDLLNESEADFFFHEIYSWFPSRGNEPLTQVQRVFLSQGAKEGNDIYFCTQDFSLAHKGFRFLVNELNYVIKLVGSDRPRRSAPPVKRIWGLVLYWELDPKSFKGDDVSMEFLDIWPSWYFINREDTELYDTSYKVKGIGLPPIKMTEQEIIYYNLQGEEVKREKKWAKL